MQRVGDSNPTKNINSYTMCVKIHFLLMEQPINMKVISISVNAGMQLSSETSVQGITPPQNQTAFILFFNQFKIIRSLKFYSWSLYRQIRVMFINESLISKFIINKCSKAFININLFTFYQ